MAADPFSAVPYEIVAHILSFVPRPDLPTVCLINQSLCRCAEPILCSDITLEWTHQRKSPPIIPLLQKLFRRPELFDCIDAVSLTGDDFVGRDPSPPLTATESTVTEFERIIKSFDAPFADAWVEKLREGSMDAFAALLIAHLSKVRRLTITDNYIRRLDLIGKTLQSKAIGQHLPRFERLKLITYFHGFDYYAPAPPHRSDEVMALFHVPTVTHLAAQMGSTELFHWPAGEPDLGCLTSLDLEGCCATFMAKILALTRSLKSLSWRWEYAPETDDPWMTTDLDLDEIISALSYVKDTLEKLQFRITVYSGYRREGEPAMDVSGSFGGLVNFNRLTEIEVPLACLADFGAQPQPLDRHVPRSVEILSLSTSMLYNEGVLWIPDDEWPTDQDVVQLLQQLVKSYPTKLPQLRLVKIIDDISCFENRQFDEMLANTPLDIDIEVVRSISPLWDISV
ncbi:unnamed protein product [Clonostachys byssicola]|uniref:F-box domain-containing protein n=1 Tax=Clonostachys byssicola TaxID=160290 RepID=A0A9N9UEA9_9HYPO|nr:unnamed protein product [Clonostachys byssicola]